MNASLILSISGGTAEDVSLDDVRKFAQQAVDQFGKGLSVRAELRHGNPAMPTVEVVSGTPVALGATGMVDETKLTERALRDEAQVTAEAGREFGKTVDRNPPAPDAAAAFVAAPADETQREAAKVRAGAATADEVPGNEVRSPGTPEPNRDQQATESAAALADVKFASASARQAAIDANLNAEQFARKRRSSKRGFTAADVERIAAGSAADEGEEA